MITEPLVGQSYTVNTNHQFHAGKKGTLEFMALDTVKDSYTIAVLCTEKTNSCKTMIAVDKEDLR